MLGWFFVPYKTCGGGRAMANRAKKTDKNKLELWMPFIENKLTAREIVIITLYYGIEYRNRMRSFNVEREGPMSLQKIGKEIGLGRERVRQIKNRALCKIAKYVFL